MQIDCVNTKLGQVGTQLLALPVFDKETIGSSRFRSLGRRLQGVLKGVMESGEFKAGKFRTCLIHNPPGLKAHRLLLVGAGPKEGFSLAAVREIAGAVVRSAQACRARTVAMVDRSDHGQEKISRAIAEGALYGSFESDIYKTQHRDARKVDRFSLVIRGRILSSAVSKGLHDGTVIGEATNFARTLVNEPSNVLTPVELVKRAQEIGPSVGLDVKALDREEMERLGMNALLAVSRGSQEEPRLMILRLKGQSKSRASSMCRAFIGKGVTFDSGGISIKPAARMEDMKADMAGGAAVLGAMMALAQLRPRQKVIGLVPAVENLPSGTSVKPGDIVTSYSGKTIEIINTDAEGRLIMADALAYARTLGATHALDIATLTGACMVALGTVNAGMMGTDDATIRRLRRNISSTGEKLWQLPLDNEYQKAIESEIADVKNVGNRWGGAITAGKFLQEFVDHTPWVHIDIAGKELDHDGCPYRSKGATGFGVRTLVELVS